MSFNTFGNRDDTSIKLRAQNQQILSKEQTKLLEMETEKMAERLMELKIAMSREKEEREKTFRGGGFWHSGQAGSLGSYPKEVISKPMKPKEQSAKQKITWLKNEPIVLPERTKGPCTIACIAERKLPSDKGSNPKFKGRRCGQCEEKAAHVSCTECGEDYCAACFTAFHLKGALKKHRSTPIGSGGLRTPRADATRIAKDDYKENVQQTFADRKNEKTTTSTLTDSDMRRIGIVSKGTSKEITVGSKSTPPVQRQGNFSDDGGSLLEGTYNPIENQRQFQEALLEWRQGGKSMENRDTRPAQAKTPQADVSVETLTEGMIRQPIDIKFSSHSLSYAERLMLKKHRRMELGTLPGSPSPSLASAADEVPMNDPITDRKDRLHRSSDQEEDEDAFSEDGRRSRLSAMDSEGSSHRKSLDGFLASSRSQANNSFIADSSRPKNDLRQMSPAIRKACSARLPTERQKAIPAAKRTRPDETKLSIVELTKPLSKRDIIGLERSTTYHVTEIPDPVSARTTSNHPANRRISSRPRVRKDAFFSSPSGSLDLSIQPRPPRKPLVVTQTSVEAFDAPRKVLSSSKDTSVRVKDSLNSKPNSENMSSQSKLNASKTSLNSAKTSVAKPVSSRLKQKGGRGEVELAESVSGVGGENGTHSETSSRAKEVPGSRAASKLGKDAKQGQLDEARTDSAMNPRIKPRVPSRQQSQMASRQSQRPKSQAGSRPSSRLASYRDGCLTKVASEALRSVARLADASATSQQVDLGAYFTMAVHPDRGKEVMTPVSSRPNSARPNGRWKVSNTLYQMAPRSWKPDTSLVETVSEDQVQQIIREGQHLTMEATTTEAPSLPKATTLSWSLGQGLSSANSPEHSNRVAAEELGPSGGKKKKSDLEISDEKVTHSEVKSNSKTELKSLPKEEASNEVKLKFVQGHSVTPNMMIPARFRRPGSGTSGRESQCGSRTGRESQCGSRTDRESQCGSRTGRESQMIVYDGDVLSNYDEQEFAEQQRENDAEAMKRLDSEIASETGLMAADVSEMHSENKVRDETDCAKLSKSLHENVSTTFHKLRESQLMSDFEEMEAKIMDGYEEEVKALK